MITYLDVPLSGIYTVNGHDVLIIAFVAGSPNDGHPKISVVYVDEDGWMGQAQLSEVNVNWRYDNNRHVWRDVGLGEESNDGDGPN